jgi:uncharacterized RDD family membrane protein YckC/TM2 domain-containing membrane protein YozV
MTAKSKSTTFLLCCYFGWLGVHRFYLNKIATGLLMLITVLLCCCLAWFGVHHFYLNKVAIGMLMLITLGGLGVWVMIDAYLIARGKMSDNHGEHLFVGPADPENPKAGFWVRVAAMSLDSIVLQIIVLLAFLIFIGLPALAGVALEIGFITDMILLAQAGNPLIIAIPGLLAVAIYVLYFSHPLSSKFLATPGKRAFGIYVNKMNSERVSFMRALLRTCCYLLSALPLFLGFIMAGFKNKRALHDWLSGTQVLYVVDSWSPPFNVANTETSTDTAIESDTTTESDTMNASPAVARENTESQITRGPMIILGLGTLLLLGAAALALL